MAERRIHILPEQVASQIAAGEVVERPASALKELVENSLDAGAGAISIEIERGGAGLIAVGDDGCGMGREDAILSLRRHATSKIRDAADLAAIRTMGFRGEALASIASVARMRMVTRRTADLAGVEIAAAGGEISTTRECAAATGTRIEVRELFFNTPARLKFLKTLATEQGAAAEVIARLAIAHWRVAFKLVAEGRVVYDLPRTASVLERMRQLYGAKVASRMLPFDSERAGARVFGLATISHDSYPTPRMVFTFVNRRAVRDRVLQRAVVQAYDTLIPRGRYPATAVFVEMRPEDVDVNVHPMKTEVRFRNSGAVFEAVYHALRARLADQTADQTTNVAAGAGAPSAAVAPQLIGAPALHPEASADAARALRLVPDAPAPARAEQRALGLGVPGPKWTSNAAAEATALYDASAGGEPAAAPGAAAVAPATPSIPAIGGGQVVPLLRPGERHIPMYSRLRIVGQLFAGYIALESDDGLILVDQHAAHERVTFEKLRAELRAGGIRVQAMLTPVPIELNPARAPQVHQALSEFRAMGFDLEPFGPATLLLKGAPAVFGADGGARLLIEMIDAMGEDGFRGDGLRPGNTTAFEDLLKQLACHGSVRVGRVLREPEISALLEELDRTEFKTNCPHGRPVHIQWGRGLIERMFRR
ncbi:MAG TPA: DNA mismatch repair endonuclease MutL [Candidatus Binataceae bacterium]|nr:DNA mismatch repair endonuclease MutL [Candidatus Binataceae bacterium]